MSLFAFSPEEMLCFFAVLVRFSVLIMVLPLTGDRFVPGPAKVLLALAITIALFPAILARGEVRMADAVIWGASAGGIVSTVFLEALCGLVIGFSARLCFDTINFGANLASNFMGFSMASHFDPHQESQTQVAAEIQMAIAMLMFLVLDGHHLMLSAALDSYSIVGMGQAGIGALVGRRLIELTSQVITLGLQISAPVAVSVFAVNVAFGVFAKAIPQLNILILSLGVTALVGLSVMFISMPHFAAACSSILERMGDWMRLTMMALVGRG